MIRRQPSLENLQQSDVREIYASLHDGGPIKGPLKPPITSQHYRNEGFKGRVLREQPM